MAPLEEEAAEAVREGARSVRVQKGPGLEQVLALAQRQRERFVPRTRRGLRLRHEGAEQPATPQAELGAAPWRGEGPREKRRRVPSHEGAELGRGGLRGEAAWARADGRPHRNTSRGSGLDPLTQNTHARSLGYHVRFSSRLSILRYAHIECAHRRKIAVAPCVSKLAE